MDKFYKYFLSIFAMLSFFFILIATDSHESLDAPGAYIPPVFAFSTKSSDIRYGYDRFGMEKYEKNSFVYKNRTNR